MAVPERTWGAQALTYLLRARGQVELVSEAHDGVARVHHVKHVGDLRKEKKRRKTSPRVQQSAIAGVAEPQVSSAAGYTCERVREREG
jgi:hypothetical protein